VDPEVGTQRRAIAIKAGFPDHGTHYFVGPDNGLLIPAARSMGEFEVYEVTNKALFRKEISHTFHGRDIFAPVGAHISKGMEIGGVGKRMDDFVDMDFGEGHRTDGSLEGRVIFIDQFGNIVTNIPSEVVGFEPGDILEFQKKKVIFQSSYGLCKVSEPLILIGSHGYLEIAINRGNAASYFNIESGDNLIIEKILKLPCNLI
jgi:S-adenosyl-L-methionine hydrolase (adenosine-forming)